MKALINMLLALFVIAGYGGYAVYEHARGDTVPHAGKPTQPAPVAKVAQKPVVTPVAASTPKPKATVVSQTRTESPAPSNNSTVASISGSYQVPAETQPIPQTVSQPTPAPTPAPTPQPVVQPQPAAPAGRYRDGTYTGSSVDVFYGFVQVQATVSGGNLTDVAFLSYPSDRRQSIQINQYAMPRLVQQAISAQSANVSGVSGATDTSYGFQQSLAAALAQA